MIELGQLERHHQDFARRNTRVIVVSMEGVTEAEQTQAQLPHLTVLADADADLTKAVGVVHPGAAHGKDAAMPTTILVDRGGTVRWIYRSNEVLARLAPHALSQAIDQNLGDR